MPGVNWEAVERLVRPLYSDDPLRDWEMARRMARQAAFLCDGFDPFDRDRAKLLCWFTPLRDRAADPDERRGWMRPMRDAGVALPAQTWLWIALDRYLDAPATDEERVVHDARSLERVGATGIARAFMAGGQARRSVPETVAAVVAKSPAFSRS